MPETARTTTPADPGPLAGVTARAGHMMGAAARSWSPAEAVAWEGLLEVSRRLRRDAEALLEERHGLSVSMLGIMGRLITAPDRTLRQTDLADATGLSLSRISRVIDTLQERGLVGRRRCPSDARATNVTLTPGGVTATQAAQATTHTFVRSAFMDRLSATEVAVLAAVFSRLIGEGDVPACS